MLENSKFALTVCRERTISGFDFGSRIVREMGEL